MEESEAKEKVCPKLSHVEHSGRSNSYGKVIQESYYNYVKCLGSKCMAWQWDLVKVSDSLGASWQPSTTDGYCDVFPKECDCNGI